MRFTIALLASSLVMAVAAGSHRGHRHLHRLRRNIDVVTVEDVELVTTTVWVTVDAQYSTDALVLTTTSINSTLVAAATPSVSLPAAAMVPSAAVKDYAYPLPTGEFVAATALIGHDEQYYPSQTPSTFAISTRPATSVPVPAVSIPVVSTPAVAVPVVSSTPAPVVHTTLIPVVRPTTTAIATTSSTPSTLSGKRGLAYNDASLTSGFAGSSLVSWAYNWGQTSEGLASGFEYVPMLWGLTKNGNDFTKGWAQNAAAAIASGSTHLFSFNEPDLGAQSDLSVAAAAAGFKTHMQPFAGQAKLLAPAVTNGGAPMGLTYLKSFLSACDSCTIDAINLHWYDSASNVAYFKNYIQDAYKAGGGRPVWITEFGASGSLAEQNNFLEQVLPWLDAQDYVQRYAYFMCNDGNLLSTGKTLSLIGNTFKSFAS